MTASAALHGAVLWFALSAAAETPERAASAADVWQNPWMPVELEAAPVGAPALAEPLPARPAPKTRVTDVSPAAKVAAPPPPTKVKPAAAQPPKQAALPTAAKARPRPKSVQKPRRPPAPAPKQAGETQEVTSAEDDWLGESGSVEAAAPAAPPKEDPFIARLRAAERRKAAAREAEEAAREQAVAARARAQRAESSASPPAPTSALPAGVRNLATAVTRAIPYATQGYPGWQRLPAGTVGRITLTLQLRAGKLRPYDEQANRESPAALRQLEKSTFALLRGGRFMIPEAAGSGRQAGRQRLEVTVRLSDRAPRDALAIGFRPPKAGAAGNAYFILPSGRRFDAFVKLKP